MSFLCTPSRHPVGDADTPALDLLRARARASIPPFATRRSPTFGDRAGRAADGSVTERHILLRDCWVVIFGTSHIVGPRLPAR